MIYDGVLYFNNSPVVIPNSETVVTKNVKKKSKKIGAKLFDINTSDYKKLTSNKRVEIIQLFDKLDEKIFSNITEYKEYIQTKNKGDTVKVKIIRNKKERVIDCNVYETKGVKLIGVILQVVKEYETDPKVNITFNKSESGPSGGLITTLEIYNQLTKKDLTKGNEIAGTGTIETDGTIGQIGGIKYKVLGAEHGKAKYFLAPSGQNYKEAVKYKKEKKLKIKIIEVKNIKDAINKLEGLK